MLHLYEWQEDVQQNIATRNIKESSFFQINESVFRPHLFICFVSSISLIFQDRANTCKNQIQILVFVVKLRYSMKELCHR